MMKTFKMYGAYCEMLTSFFDDGSIDYAGFEKMIDYQIEQGIYGFFINGEGAESLHMTNEERINIAKVTCRRVMGRLPIIGGIVMNTRYEAAEIVKEYNRLDGINAICAIPPMLIPISDDAKYEYFKMIADLSEKPVFLYNQPSTGNDLSEKFVVQLATNEEKILGYKDATQNIVMLQSLISKLGTENFSFFAGSDAFIWPMATLNCPCVISLISVAFPKPIVDFYKLFENGEYQAAYNKSVEILRMREILKQDFPKGSKAGYLYGTELAGVPIRGTRLPVAYLDITDEQKRRIETNAKQFGWL